MHDDLGGPLAETITLQKAKKLIQCMAHEQSFLLLAPPGVGKSDIVYQAAHEAGLPCRSLLGTQIAPEDVSGVPRIVGERSVFCPPRVAAARTCRTVLPVPRRAARMRAGRAEGVLLAAARTPAGRVRAARGNVGGRRGHRVQDRALVRTMSSALVNRVTILQIRVDVDEWQAWAARNGVRADVRSFIHYLPDALERPVPQEPVPFSTPRAWALLSRSLDMAEASASSTGRRGVRSPSASSRRGRVGVLRAGRGNDRADAPARGLRARPAALARRRGRAGSSSTASAGACATNGSKTCPHAPSTASSTACPRNTSSPCSPISSRAGRHSARSRRCSRS